MRVVVDKAFGPYRVGDEIPDMPGNQARTMIARGLVHEADYPTRPLPSPANRMMTASPATAGRRNRRAGA